MLIAGFNAYIGLIEGNRAGHLSEMIRVEADYENAGVCGTLTFDAPLADAPLYYVGKRLTIQIKESDLPPS